MRFHSIDLCDKESFSRLTKGNSLYRYSSYESNFETLFCFSNDLKIECAEENGIMYIRSFEDGMCKFYPPLAESAEDFVVGVTNLIALAKAENVPFVLEGITLAELPILESAKLGNFCFNGNRANFEYLYRPNKLTVFNEETQREKYNQLMSFNKRVKYVFRAYSEEDYPRIEALFTRWLEMKHISTYDHAPMMKAVKNFRELGLIIGVIESKGEIVAVSIAKVTDNNDAIILFEKADHKIYGSNAALVNIFANAYLKNVRFVNRQEDMGDAGLRNSKLSYHPDAFIAKYVMSEGLQL